MGTVTVIGWHHTDADPWQFGREHDNRGSPWWGLTVGERYDGDTTGTVGVAVSA